MKFDVQHLVTLEKNLQAAMVDRFDDLMSDPLLLYWDELAETKTSSALEEIFEWQVNMAKIRASDDAGTRRYDDLWDWAYAIKNGDYEASLNLLKKEIDDDRLQRATQWASDIGGYAALFPQLALQELLAKGETELGYDGKPYFSEEHLVVPGLPAKGVAANLFTGMPLNATNLPLAVQLVKETPAAGGLNAYIRPYRLWTAPDTEFTGTELLTAKFIGKDGSTDNILSRYGFEGGPRVMQDHPSDGSWYLQCKVLGKSPFRKPFVWQVREAWNMTTYTSASDAELGRAKSCEWQQDGRYAMAYGEHWALFKFKP